MTQESWLGRHLPQLLFLFSGVYLSRSITASTMALFGFMMHCTGSPKVACPAQYSYGHVSYGGKVVVAFTFCSIYLPPCSSLFTHRYFKCRRGHALFANAAKVEVLSEPASSTGRCDVSSPADTTKTRISLSFPPTHSCGAPIAAASSITSGDGWVL